MTTHLQCGHVGPYRQQGQSLTELLVVGLVLVPMMLTVPLLGSYMDVAQHTELASRYVTFEGTIHNNNSLHGWKSDAELGTEVRRRFFGRSDAPVKTGDVAGNFLADRNPLWKDHRGNALIQDFDADVSVETRRSNKNVLPAAIYAKGGGVLGGFKLSRENLHHGTVAVSLANVTDLVPFDALNLVISKRGVVLADAWNANGPSTVKNKVEDAGGLAYPIAPLKLLGDTIGQMPALFRDPTMDVGDINPEIVPCDRLTPAC